MSNNVPNLGMLKNTIFTLCPIAVAFFHSALLYIEGMWWLASDDIVIFHMCLQTQAGTVSEA